MGKFWFQAYQVAKPVYFANKAASSEEQISLISDAPIRDGILMTFVPKQDETLACLMDGETFVTLYMFV